MTTLSTFRVDDVIQMLAISEKKNVSITGIDDLCYGMVISSDPSLYDVLNQHRGPMNFKFNDGDPIRIRRRPINASLTFDFTIAQADCIKPSKDGASYSFKRPNPLDLPSLSTISYIDVDRAFTTTTQEWKHRRKRQSARLASASFSHFADTNAAKTRVVQSATLDFIMSADQVRQMAADWHYRTWAQATFSFVHPNLDVEGGDTILFEADAGEFSLLVDENTITPDRLNKIDATVFLTSSGAVVGGVSVPAGFTVPGGAADSFSTYLPEDDFAAWLITS